jgi:hypothetical protein
LKKKDKGQPSLSFFMAINYRIQELEVEKAKADCNGCKKAIEHKIEGYRQILKEKIGGRE